MYLPTLYKVAPLILDQDQRSNPESTQNHIDCEKIHHKDWKLSPMTNIVHMDTVYTSTNHAWPVKQKALTLMWT